MILRIKCYGYGLNCLMVFTYEKYSSAPIVSWWRQSYDHICNKIVCTSYACFSCESAHDLKFTLLYAWTLLLSTSSHNKVFVHWMPRPCVPKQWDLGQKLRCLWKAWSMAFHALKVVKWALMTPSGHKLTKCKKCQVLTHKKWQK